MTTAAQERLPKEYAKSTSGKRRARLENQLYTIYQSQRISDQIRHVLENLPAPYSTRVLLGLISFLIFDAILTLSILDLGTNLTLGAVLLNKDIATFFMLKSLVSATFLGLFTVYKHYEFSRRVSGKHLLLSSGLAYLGLIGYLNNIAGSL